jgi:hypothetical protein
MATNGATSVRRDAKVSRPPNRDEILARAENLATTLGSKTLPIPLGRIAKKQRVKRIDFRPLLVAGCLEVEEDGFNIYVSADKEKAPLYSAWARDLRAESQLPGRMRFTIAHEIAHTLLYDERSSPPRDLFEPESQEGLELLESICNAAAAEILLPQSVVRRTAVAMDFLDPDGLRQLCREAAVSPETLVIKTRRNTDWLHDVGGIMSVERGAVGWQITAIALHGELEGVFGRVGKGSSIQKITNAANFYLNGGTFRRLTTIINYETQSSIGFQRFEIACETAPPQQRSLLVTLRARSDPWFV